MKKRIIEFIFIFFVSTFLFFLFILILPIGKLFSYLFLSSDDIIYTYLIEYSKKNIISEDLLKTDLLYILVKNDLLKTCKSYLNSFKIDDMKPKEKVRILNYFGYFYFKINDLENAKYYLINACKINPNDIVSVHNLNFILNLLNKKEDNKDNLDSNKIKSDILDFQDAYNLQNAVNQLIRSKLNNNKDTQNDRYW